MINRRVRPQYGIIVTIIYAIFMILLLLYLSATIRNNGIYNFTVWLLFLGVILLVFFLGWVLISLFIMKPKRIQYGDESVHVFQHEIPISTIEKIMIRGYFIQTIGILPKNKNRVPASFCFKFTGNEEDGIKELTEWANLRKIEVVKENFKSWI